MKKRNFKQKEQAEHLTPQLHGAAIHERQDPQVPSHFYGAKGSTDHAQPSIAVCRLSLFHEGLTCVVAEDTWVS